MILPGDASERHKAFRNMVRSCEMNSRETRRSEENYLDRCYENGGENEKAEYNMLDQMVNTSSSYLFDPEAVRLEVALTERYGDLFIEEEDAARNDLQREMHNAGDFHVIAQAVEYGHVRPSVFVKAFGRGDEITLGALSSSADFGTPYEDLDTIDALPYFTHWYTLTPSQFERLIAFHPQYERLMRVVMDYMAAPDRPRSQALPATLQISAVSPTMIGAANQLPTALTEPRVLEPVVKLAELWWFDSEIADYRTATIFIPTMDVLWETLKNPLEIKGEHPMIQLCLKPKPGYLYGRALLNLIIPLQIRRNEILDDVYRVLKRQLDPAIMLDGFPGLVEEKVERIISQGGVVSSPMPGATAKPMPPTMPPDVWSVTREIDTMAARLWGLPQSAYGEGQANVRSGQQESELANLGSPVLRRRSGIVASFIEAAATKKLRMRQKELASPLKKSDPESAVAVGESSVLLSQIPEDLYARVWGHSASPISSAAIERKAIIAFREKAISPESFIELLDLPFPEKMRRDARKMMKAASEYKGMAMQLKEREVKAKEEKAAKA